MYESLCNWIFNIHVISRNFTFRNPLYKSDLAHRSVVEFLLCWKSKLIPLCCKHRKTCNSVVLVPTALWLPGPDCESACPVRERHISVGGNCGERKCVFLFWSKRLEERILGGCPEFKYALIFRVIRNMSAGARLSAVEISGFWGSLHSRQRKRSAVPFARGAALGEWNLGVWNVCTVLLIKGEFYLCLPLLWITLMFFIYWIMCG